MKAKAGGSGTIDEALLLQVLEWRLSKADTARGSIIDGLNNSYGVSGVLATRCLREAAPGIAMIQLDISQDDYIQLLKKVDNEAAFIMDLYAQQQSQQDGVAAAESLFGAATGTPGSETSLTRAISYVKQTSHISTASALSLPTSTKGTSSQPIAAEACAMAEATRHLISQMYEAETGTLKESLVYFSVLRDIVEAFETPSVPINEVISHVTEPGPSSPAMCLVYIQPDQPLSEMVNKALSSCPEPMVPLPLPNDVPIPRPKTYELLQRPVPRLGRSPPKTFTIVRADCGDGIKVSTCVPHLVKAFMLITCIHLCLLPRTTTAGSCLPILPRPSMSGFLRLIWAVMRPTLTSRLWGFPSSLPFLV